MDRRVFVLALALLLLPFPLQVAASEAPEARVLPLYLQAGLDPGAVPVHGLSALMGDAMRSDTTTIAASGELRAATRVLERELVLEPQDAFRLSFPVVHQSGDAVNATIEVRATDLLGRNVTLAYAEYRPPTPSATREPVAAAMSALPTDAARESAETAIATVGPATEGNIAWGALNTTYDLPMMCGGTNKNVQCNQTTGHHGYGQLRWCKGPRTVGVGRTLYDQMAQVDRVFGDATPPLPAPLSRVAPCTGAFDVANDTAAAAPAPDVLPPFPETPNGTDYTPPPWNDLRLDAVAPSLTREDGRIVIPAGYRLMLLVEAWASPHGPFPDTSVAFELGRADAPARLEVRTFSQGAFADLAYGSELIGLGPHTGAYANATDVRHYAVDLAHGQRLQVTPGSGTIVTLRDPDGVAQPGAAPTSSGSAGRWTVSVARAAAATSTYAFDLAMLVPPSPATPLAEGPNADAVGLGDDEDAFFFAAYKGQWFTLTFSAPTSGAGAGELTIDPKDLVSGSLSQRVEPDGTVVHTGRARDTSVVNVTVRRAWGSFDYGIDLWRDPEGDLTTRPTFTTLLAVPGNTLSLVGGFQGAADVAMNGSIHRVAPEGSIALGPDALDPVSFRYPLAAHAADGAIVGRTIYFDGGYSAGGIGLLRGGEVDLVLGRSGPHAFGPDGRLYVLERGANSTLLALGQDRVEETVVGLPFVAEQLIFTPEGSAVVADGDGASYAVDLATGAVESAPAAFPLMDAEGNGYRILSTSGIAGSLVERVDKDDGRTTTAAWVNGYIHELTVSGTRLYAITSAALTFPTSYRLAYVDLGTPMFEGFQPDFEPAPAADIVPVGVELSDGGVYVSESGAQVRYVIHATFENAGAGVAVPSRAQVLHRCPSECDMFYVPLPGLAPGERVTIDVVWTTTPRVGDQHFSLWADFDHDVTESDEANNRVEYSIPNIVATDEACGDLPVTVYDCHRISV